MEIPSSRSLQSVLVEREQFTPDADQIIADVQTALRSRRQRRPGLVLAAAAGVTAILMTAGVVVRQSVVTAVGRTPAISTAADQSILPPVTVPLSLPSPQTNVITEWTVDRAEGGATTVSFVQGDASFTIRTSNTQPPNGGGSDEPTTVQGRPAVLRTNGETTLLVWQQPSGTWVELGATNPAATVDLLYAIAETVLDRPSPLESALVVSYVPAGYELVSQSGTGGSAPTGAGDRAEHRSLVRRALISASGVPTAHPRGHPVDLLRWAHRYVLAAGEGRGLDVAREDTVKPASTRS